MTEKVVLRLNCLVKRIPDGDADTPEFVAWCKEHDVHPLGGERRGWCSWLNGYIGWSAYLVYFGDQAFLMTEGEYQEAIRG